MLLTEEGYIFISNVYLLIKYGRVNGIFFYISKNYPDRSDKYFFSPSQLSNITSPFKL